MRELAQAASETDGWATLVDEDGMTMLIKQQDHFPSDQGQHSAMEGGRNGVYGTIW